MPYRRTGLLAAAVLALVTLAPAAFAAPDAGSGRPGPASAAKGDRGAKARAHASDKGARRATPKGPTSIGAPNGGRLAGGIPLKPSRHLHLRTGARAYGLPALVRLLHRAADAVAKAHKGSVMLVGDISAKKGGPLDGHNSHQSGRDVDVAFYVTNSKGKPATPAHFVAFDGEGKGREVEWARFDDARNWALVEALVRDEKAGVRYLFITNGLRARLLAHAAKKRVPREILARASAAMMSPADADLHDDHFHVRIACPESMRGVCVEESAARGEAAVERRAGAHVAGSAAVARGAATAVATPAPTKAEPDAPAKSGEPKAAEPKVAEPKAADAKKAEGAKSEEPSKQADGAAATPAKASTPKGDAPKGDAPKGDAPKGDAPKG